MLMFVFFLVCLYMCMFVFSTETCSATVICDEQVLISPSIFVLYYLSYLL